MIFMINIREMWYVSKDANLWDYSSSFKGLQEEDGGNCLGWDSFKDGGNIGNWDTLVKLGT